MAEIGLNKNGIKEKNGRKSLDVKPAKKEHRQKSKNRERESKTASIPKSSRGSLTIRKSQAPSKKERVSSIPSESGMGKRIVPKERRKSSKKKNSTVKEQRKSFKRKSVKPSSEVEAMALDHAGTSKRSLEEEETAEEALAENQTSLLCSQKLAIRDAIEPCYVCNTPSPYYKGGFFCGNCRNRFEDFVQRCDYVKCSKGGKCLPQEKCNFCLSETFYSNGIKVTDVVGYHHVIKHFPPFIQTSEKVPMNKEEAEFCAHFFNKILIRVMDWVWKQGDILKLTPKDRATLLKTNVGRAGMIWIAADMVLRHNIIKTDDAYLPLNKFTSETLRQTIIDLHDLAIYFRSISVTPRHLYFLKLLGVFQIATIENCSFCVDPASKCHCAEKDFERSNDIKLIVGSYYRMLKELRIADSDIPRITEFLDLMYCSSEGMQRESKIHEAEVCFKNWAESNRQWKDRLEDEVPIIAKQYSQQRLDLCYYLNSKCNPALDCAIEHLSPHVTIRDQNAIIYQNFLLMFIAWVCWNEDLSFLRNSKDKGIMSFYHHIEPLRERIRKEVATFFKYPDFILLCLTQHFTGREIRLLDGDINHIHQLSRSTAMETVENKLRKEISEEEDLIEIIKQIEKLLDTIMETIEKTAEKLDLSIRNTPLFINCKMWVME